MYVYCKGIAFEVLIGCYRKILVRTRLPAKRKKQIKLNIIKIFIAVFVNI